MKTQTVVGLLPFYLKLYDELLPKVRPGFDGLLKGVAAHQSALKDGETVNVADWGDAPR